MDKPEITHKTCSKCGEVKVVGEFGKHKSKHDGRQSYCKPCFKKVKDEWKANNQDKYKKQIKEYAVKTLLKSREKSKKYRARNLEKCKKRCSDYAKSHPDLMAEKARRYRKNNPDVMKKMVAKLSPAYVAATLHIPVAQLTPDLAELKRTAITIHRAIRESNQLIKELK